MIPRTACYHGVAGTDRGRYGQRCTVLVRAPKPKTSDHGPVNVLVEFPDGTRAVTSVGCIKWACEKHREEGTE